MRLLLACSSLPVSFTEISQTVKRKLTYCSSDIYTKALSLIILDIDTDRAPRFRPNPKKSGFHDEANCCFNSERIEIMR